jgi:hypothetical protein
VTAYTGAVVTTTAAYGHIAFEFEDVAAARQDVLSASGGNVANLPERERDMIELQTWAAKEISVS